MAVPGAAATVGATGWTPEFQGIAGAGATDGSRRRLDNRRRRWPSATGAAGASSAGAAANGGAGVLPPRGDNGGCVVTRPLIVRISEYSHRNDNRPDNCYCEWFHQGNSPVRVFSTASPDPCATW